MLDTSLKRENSGEFEEDGLPLEVILPEKEDLQVTVAEIRENQNKL